MIMIGPLLIGAPHVRSRLAGWPAAGWPANLYKAEGGDASHAPPPSSAVAQARSTRSNAIGPLMASPADGRPCRLASHRSECTHRGCLLWAEHRLSVSEGPRARDRHHAYAPLGGGLRRRVQGLGEALRKRHDALSLGRIGASWVREERMDEAAG